MRKAESVSAALAEYPGSPEVLACAGVVQRFEWRTRVKWVVDGDRIGLYGPGHVVVDTPECRVAPRAALEVAAILREAARRLGEGDGQARLSGVDLRVTERSEVAVVLIVEAEEGATARRLAERLAAALPEGPSAAVEGASARPWRVVSVAASHRRPGAHTVLGGAPEPLRGQSVISDRIGRSTAAFPPGAFSQAHRDGATALHDAVLAAAGRPGTAVDLHAGTGGIAFALAKVSRRVIAVEPFPPAADAARRLAPRNVEVITGRAEDAWGRQDGAGRGPGREQGFGGGRHPEGGPQRPRREHESLRPLVLVADPPRTGLTMESIRAMVQAAPDSIVMVSCDPLTLARDLDALRSLGYAATTPAQPLDLMPWTHHVETVVRLVPVPPEVVTTLAEDLVLAEKPALLPTIPHPEWPDSLLDRVRRAVSPELQAAHRLDVGTSGLVVFSPRGSQVLLGAEKTYRAWVRGITRRKGHLTMPLDEDGRSVPASTHFHRLRVVAGHSLVEATLGTGRRHQLRRHFAAIGHPILGDARYGDPRTNAYVYARHGLFRPFLHAERLALPDGHVFESSLAPDLAAALARAEAES